MTLSTIVLMSPLISRITFLFSAGQSSTSSVAALCQEMSQRMQDSNVKLETRKAWWCGLMGHACSIRLRDSEGRAVESSSVSVMTGIVLSLCLGEQTNNRAELLAGQSWRCKNKNLDTRSDSDRVGPVATGLLPGERHLNNESDAELLDEFVTELRLKATRQLSFLWIKRHATKITLTRRSLPLRAEEKRCCGRTGVYCCGTSRSSAGTD